MNHSTNLVIISGPSGAGEDSVIEGMRKRGIPIERVVTTIARLKRTGESEGHPYYFVSKKTFDRMIQNNEFVEWADVYDSKRGMTKKELERVQRSGKIGIWKIDFKGLAAAKKIFPGILSVFISATLEDMLERLKKRGDDPKKIQKRVAYSEEFLKHADEYDYIVKNEQGKLNKTINEVIEILKKEGFIDKTTKNN